VFQLWDNLKDDTGAIRTAEGSRAIQSASRVHQTGKRATAAVTVAKTSQNSLAISA
jgi:hypothetical protein